MSEAVPRVSHVVVREEIWQSWISMLRSYAALAGVSGGKYAVTSLSDWAIVEHQGRFVRFCFNSRTGVGVWTAGAEAGDFTMSEDGSLDFGKEPEELDMAAIRWMDWLAED